MILADTGPLVAIANERDQHHSECLQLLETRPVRFGRAPVVVEVCQLLASRRGTRAQAAFLSSLRAGALEVVTLDVDHYTRAARLVEQYADLRSALRTRPWSLWPKRLVLSKSRPSTTATSPSCGLHVDAFTFFPGAAAVAERQLRAERGCSVRSLRPVPG